jgi:hypothetical protein
VTLPSSAVSQVLTSTGGHFFSDKTAKTSCLQHVKLYKHCCFRKKSINSQLLHSIAVTAGDSVSDSIVLMEINGTNLRLRIVRRRTGWLSRYSDWLRVEWSGDRIPVRVRFPAPVQTGPGAHPASCTMGTVSFPGVKSGRGVTLIPHPF